MPALRVECRLLHPTHGALSPHNVAGQRMEIMFAGWRGAGEYDARLSAAALPSGACFVRVSSGGQVVTTKAVILK